MFLTLAALAMLAIPAAAQTEPFDALMNRSFDRASKSLRVNMSASPSGIPNPQTYGVDQIFNWSFDRTNQALRFTCMAGCAGGSTPRLDQILDPTADWSPSMTDKKVTMTWGASTGANDLFNITDTTANTGSGYLANFTMASGTSLAGGLKLRFADETTYGAILNVGYDPALSAYPGWVPGLLINGDSRFFSRQGSPIVAVSEGTVFPPAQFVGVAGISQMSALLVDIHNPSTTNSDSFGIWIRRYQEGTTPYNALRGIFISDTQVTGSGLDENVAIEIDDQVSGIRNFAFRSGLGQIFHGDRLTVKSSPASVQKVTFTGAGLNDATSGGTYTGLDDLAYCVQIDTSVPSPNTFEWGTGGSCSNGATGVGITGAAQNLSNGVQITFAAINDHTIGDDWTFTAYAPIPLTLQDHSGNIKFRVKETGTVNVNGSDGITDSGSSCAITAITGGIITGATCTP